MQFKLASKFIGDLKWFASKQTRGKYSDVKHALLAHLSYISKRAVLSVNTDPERWKELANKELSRRYDARIAGKFFVALPNDMKPEDGVKLVLEFVSRTLGSSYVAVAIHDGKGMISGEKNLHAHIVFYSRDKEGRRIKIDKEKFREMHRVWEECLKDYGYAVIKAPKSFQRERVFINRRKPDEALVESIRLWNEARRCAIEAYLLEKVYEKSLDKQISKNKSRNPDIGLEL